MNINPTTIKAYTFTLSESELLAATANPAHFVNLLVAGVGGDTNPVATAKRRPSKKTARHNKAKKLAGLKKAAASIGRSASPGLAKVRCPQCGDEIASKYLNLHLRKKHSSEVEAN